MGPCDRSKGRVCTEKGEGVPIVKRRKRGGKGIHLRATEEGVYPTVQITTDGTGIFCRKEEWKEAYGAGLQVLK